jgi:GTP cyclohydrolase-4
MRPRIELMSTPPDFSKVDSKSFVDIPSSRPLNQIPLLRVGITNRPLALTLKDPFTDEAKVLPCKISLFSSLKGDQRGIHMSRLEEAIDELRFLGLPINHFTSQLAQLIVKTQEQREAYVKLEATLEHRVNKNVSGKSSIELITLLAATSVNTESQDKQSLGVAAPFINACPCTQRWGMREFFNTLKQRGYSPEEAETLTLIAPLQAHTNRGTATVTITDTKNLTLTPFDIYGVIDRSVPIIRELLKGPDEHQVVRAAHREGQFCEDNIRALMREIAQTFKGRIDGLAEVAINVDVDESVHSHNLTADFVGRFEELCEHF